MSAGHRPASRSAETPDDAAVVLFASVAHPELSVMAATIFNALARPALAHAVAGVTGRGECDDAVKTVMSEIGLELQTPEALTNDLVSAADVVVNLGMGETLPIFHAGQVIEWSFAAPDHQEDVARLRDELGLRVEQFLEARRLTRSHVKVTCDLERELVDELREESRRLGRPVAWLVREAWRLAREHLAELAPRGDD